MKHMGDGALTQKIADGVCICGVQVLPLVAVLMRAKCEALFFFESKTHAQMLFEFNLWLENVRYFFILLL